jgi:glycosyltransferase involved in cell wall biosynthesis
LRNVLVVTTINGKSHEGISRLIEDSKFQNFELVLIGDHKTSGSLGTIDEPRVHFYNLESQLSSKFSSGRALPLNHYARKNFGYLVAAEMGSEWISETDDDNRLFAEFWEKQDPNKAIKNSTASQWVNIYGAFGFGEYWHRGIPINEVQNSNILTTYEADTCSNIGCIQGLANGDPDIDAICRMLYNPVSNFSRKDSFVLEPGYYSPTNSQLTRWNCKQTLPLLYLPSTVPWRVSDIWRGLIAQRYFAISGLKTQFRGGLGFQDRNEHDLLKDFVDELEVHMSTRIILEILDSINILEKTQFMRAVYSTMLSRSLVSKEEIVRLDSWLTDTSAILNIG